MPGMNDIFKLAEKIKDDDLRKKTISFLKNPAISHKGMKRKKSDFRKVPSSLNWHHVYEGGLLEHTVSVAKLCIRAAEIIKSIYKVQIDMDVLISAALLHDVVKVYEYIKNGGEWEGSDMLLDHTMLCTAELYARGFPEEVIHAVASHFGEKGPTPPMTIEALILSKMDLFDAEIESVIEESVSKESMILELLKESGKEA